MTSNDYIGKGLSGGKIIVVPRKEAKFVPMKTLLSVMLHSTVLLKV